MTLIPLRFLCRRSTNVSSDGKAGLMTLQSRVCGSPCRAEQLSSDQYSLRCRLDLAGVELSLMISLNFKEQLPLMYNPLEGLSTALGQRTVFKY